MQPKPLTHVELAFRSIKAIDLKVGPIHPHLEGLVHAPLMFADEESTKLHPGGWFAGSQRPDLMVTLQLQYLSYG